MYHYFACYLFNLGKEGKISLQERKKRKREEEEEEEEEEEKQLEEKNEDVKYNENSTKNFLHKLHKL